MALGLLGPIGTPELVIILVLALVMFGGKLPEVARSLGKSVNQFKRGLKDIDENVSRDEPPPPPKSIPSSAEVAQEPAKTPPG